MTQTRSSPGRGEERAGIGTFFLGRQEDSPSLFSKGTAPPWNSEARPVVMEFLESMEDSVTQPPY